MNLRSKLSLFRYRNEVEIVEMENIGHQISSYHQTRHLLPRISFPTPSEHCLSDRKRKLPSDNEFLVFPVHILPGAMYPQPLKIAKKSGEETSTVEPTLLRSTFVRSLPTLFRVIGPSRASS